MTERRKRVRPSSGDWADRLVARLAGQPPWVLVTAMLGAGAIAGAISAVVIAGVPWHEVVAWFLVGTCFVGLLVAGALLVAMRGRSLVDEARSRHELMELDWRQFEELVGHVFRSKGWSVAPTQQEADGGADLILRRRGEHALVQCKKWHQDVGVAEVRAFYGVMAAEKVKTGFFVTAGFFTPEAERFAQAVGVQLIHGTALLREIAAARGEPPSSAESESPRCPVCGSTMRLATGRFGPFWGCSRFPDECKGWLRLSQPEIVGQAAGHTRHRRPLLRGTSASR